MSVSVVVPVKDGARWLPELLGALVEQGPDEILVVDSGSTDGSVDLARRFDGVEVLEIEPGSFGHGRTRNLAAERTHGDLICFLTQDATPLPGWLDAFRAAFADESVGAAFGPHRPRFDTSPMIARELEEFFATFPDGGWPAGEAPFLSNVNACYRRACWAALRFANVAYSEDQAFARAVAEDGRWRVAYVPGAGVLHAHDYGPLTFMRRYFDEYRGLHRTTGHVEGIGVRSTARLIREQVHRDREWLKGRGAPARDQLRWTARSALHHGGRKVASAAGSRSDKLPARVQRALSLEGHAPAPEPVPSGPRQVPAGRSSIYEPVLRIARDGAAPLVDPVPGMADAESLHVAVVIPYFRRGSGGHSTIFNLLTRMEERGHTVTTWLYDPMGFSVSEWPGVIRENLREFFRPISGPVFKGFDQWYGADVVLATGWDTVYPVLSLEHCRARAYLVQDHEPEFFATSAESLFADRTYDAGLYAICASPWLADIVRQRGAEASVFDLGVDHAVYRPLPDIERREDTVVFYARAVTPRRGVPLGMLALAELHRRRPNTRFVLYGDPDPPDAPFPFEHLGIASPEELARAYAEAAVGLSLSLTNYSLIPQEMLACGLPVVEVAGRSLEGIYGTGGPPVLVPPDPVQLADALERLLDDPGERERRAQAGLAWVADKTWDHASLQVEEGLRAALRARLAETQPEPVEPAPPPAGLPPGSAPPPTPSPYDPSARSVPVDLHVGVDASHQLFQRLSEEDVRAIYAALRRPDVEVIEGNPAAELRFLLHFGVWHRVPAVLDKTGLSPVQPPEGVHAMERGPLSAGGSLYYADMLETGVRSAGRSLTDVQRGLDFGCSSGRVVRALRACFPQAEWHGCDPNRESIAWAKEHLEGIAFLQSPTETPLPYEDASFDFVCAISIWSHYGEDAAAHWLNEMARLVRGGGTFAFTTHGLRSVEHYAATGERSRAQLAEIRRALYRRGYWFEAEFGEDGDWGVAHPQWGTAFFTPEWLLRHVRHNWTVTSYQVGQNAGNQDLYVLARR